MMLGAYLYVNRGIDYDLPFEPVIKAACAICDEVLVGTDVRFADGTYERLTDLAREYEGLRICVADFDFNVRNVHGAIKQMLREQATGEWLLELDADTYIPENKGKIIRDILPKVPPNIYVLGLGELTFFNGNNIKHDMPKVRPCISRNMPQVMHGGTQRMGSGYISNKGIKIDAGLLLCDPVRWKRSLRNHKHVWIYHYGWYSLPRKWEMKQTIHYYEGRYKGIYENVDDYKINLDNEETDFWGLPWVLPMEHYEPAILTEMRHKRVKSLRFTHPVAMQEWIARQRILNIPYWRRIAWRLGLNI